MKVLILVAVVIVLVLIVASVLGYSRRVRRNLESSAMWQPYVKTLNEIRGGRRLVNVYCARVDSKGNVYEKFVVKTLDGYTENFEQTLFDAKENAVVNCATLNS